MKHDITVRIGEGLMGRIRALRRKLMLETGRELSKAAVMRLLLFLGLREAEKKAPEALVALAEREDLL